MSNKIVAAYYGAWESIDRIDPKLCDFAYFSFFTTDSNGKISTNCAHNIENFINLRNVNPSIKLIAAIGGYSAGTYNFANMAKSSSSRRNFISSALNLIRTHSFDGIDIDWEYPGVDGTDGGASKADKQNFVTLLSELKSAMDKRNYLTVAVSAGQNIIDQAYNIRGVSDNVDMVNIMTYDYNCEVDRTGHNAPFNKVNDSVQYWINNGCQANKIVLGLASYGYKYKTVSSCGVGSSFLGNAEHISYRSISKEPTVKFSWDKTERVPHRHSKNNEWISYDSPESIVAKLEIVKNKGLCGCFFWSSNQDDYDGSSGSGKFPLMRAAHNELKNQGTNTQKTVWKFW